MDILQAHNKVDDLLEIIEDIVSDNKPVSVAILKQYVDVPDDFIRAVIRLDRSIRKHVTIELNYKELDDQCTKTN